MIGNRIIALRQSNDWSQHQLAERTGLSEKQINILESTTELPALAQLIKVARAFGTRLGTFLDDQEMLGAVLCHAKDYEKFSEHQVLHHQHENHLHYFPLANNKADRHMEPLMVTLCGTQEPTLSQHEGEEFLFVLEGSIEVRQGNNTHTLAVGDSIYYDSIIPHSLQAVGDKPARMLAVIYTPI